jgi:hypothetical protein
MSLLNDDQTADAQVTAAIPTPRCRHCESVPAANATVHAHRGLLLAFQMHSRKGPFCRDCGIASVRDMSARSLTVGWWSPSSLLINPVILLMNFRAYLRLRKLAEPADGARRPMEAGKPLLERWELMGVLVPILLVIFIVASQR